MIKELLFPPPPAEKQRRTGSSPERALGGQAAGVKAYGVVCFFGEVFGIGSAPAVEAAGAPWKAFIKTRATIVQSAQKPRLFYAKAA